MTELTLDKLPKKVLANIDLQTAFMASRCVVAAERLQLFRRLHGKELTAAAIGKKTGIVGWRLEPFLAALMALGLLKRRGRLYRNSALAEKYYVRERSIYWTRLYSKECLKEYEAFSVLEQMLTTGQDYESILGQKRKYYIEQMRKDPQWANDFTYMLYYHHRPAAAALSKNLDLTGYHNLLDVGGGSGVMSIGLVRKYSHLKATVLDIDPVIKVAKKIIRREGLTKRIATCVGDMKKKIPDGYDVVMFCDQGRLPTKTLRLAYDSLPTGGLIVWAEDFSTEDLTEPVYRLMWQIRSKDIWLITPKQAMAMLRECGFVSVKHRRLKKGLGLITGRKGRK